MSKRTTARIDGQLLSLATEIGAITGLSRAEVLERALVTGLNAWLDARDWSAVTGGEASIEATCYRFEHPDTTIPEAEQRAAEEALLAFAAEVPPPLWN